MGEGPLIGIIEDDKGILTEMKRSITTPFDAIRSALDSDPEATALI